MEQNIAKTDISLITYNNNFSFVNNTKIRNATFTFHYKCRKIAELIIHSNIWLQGGIICINIVNLL